MERMSSLDAVFLAVEDPVNHMSIGSVALFEGPAVSFEAVQRFVAAKIQFVPRCRQRVREASGVLGRPVWIDDVGFDLDDHLRHQSLLDGRASDLDGFVEALMARPLDRRRALWEMWLVDGLDDGRWAIVSKVHHCLVDGIAGTDLLAVVMDSQPDAELVAPASWEPSDEPSTADFARFSAVSALRSAINHVRGAVVALRHPRRSWERVSGTVAGARRLWYRMRRGATSLTGPIGARPRWAHTSVHLDDVATVRHAFGGTVNDVIVAATTRAFRDLLLARGEAVDDRTVTALVPVSLRAPDEHGRLDNRVADVHALLPVGIDDPVSTLRTVHDHLDDLKTSHEVDASGALLRIGDWAPRVIADRVARAVLHRQRSVETVVTNVPGPRSPLYFCGRRMVEAYPYAPIAGHVRITVAIWSYCTILSFGVTGDRETVVDLDRFVAGIDRGFTDLLNEATTVTR